MTEGLPHHVERDTRVGLPGCQRVPEVVGAEIFQPLSEINARLTFGHVTRKFAERIGVPRVVLRTHHGPIPDSPGVVPLLLPGGEDGTGAWLEIDLY